MEVMTALVGCCTGDVVVGSGGDAVEVTGGEGERDA